MPTARTIFTAASGGMEIGEPVTDGTSGSVLFVDSSGNLAQDNDELYWDNTNKALGVGGVPDNAKLEVFPSTSGQRALELVSEDKLDQETGAFLMGVYHNESVRGGEMKMFKSRGTRAAPTAITTAGESIGEISFWGHGGGNFREAAQIQVVADAGFNQHFGGRFIIWVHPDNSSAPSKERLRIDSRGRMGLNTTSADAIFHCVPEDATEVGIKVQGVASQSAHLQEWLDSAGNLLHSISENGYMKIAKTSAPADGEIDASECALWFDDTNGAGVFNIKAKTADGTVVTGSVNLS